MFKRRQVMHIRRDKAINLKEVYAATDRERRGEGKKGLEKGVIGRCVQRITRYIYIFFFVKNDIVEYLINPHSF